MPRWFPQIPFSFNASFVLQMLAATACFLGGFVLPLALPEVDPQVRQWLFLLGTVILLLAGCSLLFRRWIHMLLQKFGIHSRMLLPREGLVYLSIMLLIAVAALTGGNPDTGNMLLLVFGMMAGPFVLNGWVVVAMLSRVTISRSAPPTAPAGCFFSVEVTLHNGKRLLSSRLVEVRDQVTGPGMLEEPSVTFVRVGAGQSRTGQYSMCILRRGLYRLGPLRVSSRFPLGIGERGHSVADTCEIVVHPGIGRLLPGWKRRERELAESATRANARLGIFDDEFHSIRDYRPGDNPRAIHWRSTARQGALMVRQHEQHRESELVVLLDLFATREFTSELVEKTISLAATLCVEQTRHATAGNFRMAVAGREFQYLEVTGAGRFRDAALKALALSEPSSKAGLASMLLTVCNGPVTASSRFVLMTPRPEAARLLSEAIARDALRNEVLLTSRLLVLKADHATLNDVFLAPDSAAFPAVPGDRESEDPRVSA